MNANERGRLRWNLDALRWVWIETGPHFRVVVLRNGEWRVNPITLEALGRTR